MTQLGKHYHKLTGSNSKRKPEKVKQKLGLTQRHKEVIELMMEGLVCKEIGDRMGIKERTVKIFKEQARERLGAKTGYQLVTKYLYEKHGIKQEKPGGSGERQEVPTECE
jgi:DNA-binding CsgD family transcriptional regulator